MEFTNPRSPEQTPEDLERIEEITDVLRKSIAEEPHDGVVVVQGSSLEKVVVIDGQRIVVKYVSRESIYPAFGHGGGNTVAVREDLPPRVKQFVTAHELYHCTDRARWGGWIGREVRANIIPGMKDPVGLVVTIWATISDIDRIKFYLGRIKRGH